MEKSPLLPVKCRKTIHKLHEKLERLIAHDDCPRLTHWDLWSTNVLCRLDVTGRWRIAAVLDPHCKFAHFEAEIAYLELFHTVTPAFLKAYQQTRKLGADYHRFRKPVYQLYSLLNNVYLFGEKYAKPLLAAVERVGQIV
jgi:fructosamine-3-kinase